MIMQLYVLCENLHIFAIFSRKFATFCGNFADSWEIYSFVRKFVDCCEHVQFFT